MCLGFYPKIFVLVERTIIYTATTITTTKRQQNNHLYYAHKQNRYSIRNLIQCGFFDFTRLRPVSFVTEYIAVFQVLAPPGTGVDVRSVPKALAPKPSETAQLTISIPSLSQPPSEPTSPRKLFYQEKYMAPPRTARAVDIGHSFHCESLGIQNSRPVTVS